MKTFLKVLVVLVIIIILLIIAANIALYYAFKPNYEKVFTSLTGVPISQVDDFEAKGGGLQDHTFHYSFHSEKPIALGSNPATSTKHLTNAINELKLAFPDDISHLENADELESYSINLAEVNGISRQLLIHNKKTNYYFYTYKDW